MTFHTPEYQTLVIDDINSYIGLNHPEKAGLLERVLCRKLPIESLHPNPDDEFSNPEIGPSYAIVNNYIDLWRKDRLHGMEPELESISVEKMSTGGYMILDGHHRWLAAHRFGLDKLPVTIMNVTPITEILSAIAASERKMCVSFDLDEVLLADSSALFRLKKSSSSNGQYKKVALRKNASILIRELHNLGFDVWVYTGSYMEESKLSKFFKLNRIEVDGLINGLKNTRSRTELRKFFSEKYEVSLHIDKYTVVWVDTKKKDYDVIDITGDDNSWGSRAITAVRQIPCVQEHIHSEVCE